MGADMIVNTDVDNQYRNDGIPSLTSPVLARHADLALGERLIEEIYEFSRLKKFLKRLGTRVVRTFSATDVQNAASGYRAVNSEAAPRLRVFGRYTDAMEIRGQAGWEGLRVASVPIDVNPKTRESRLVRNIPRYVFRSATTTVWTFALYKPCRFLLVMGSPFFLIGVALITRWSG